MSDTMEGHRVEENEPLRVPAVLPDSCEFCCQRLDKAVTNSPAQRVVPPLKNHLQSSSSGLQCLVGLDPPTEVSTIVGVHLIPVYLLDPPVLLRGHVPC